MNGCVTRSKLNLQTRIDLCLLVDYEALLVKLALLLAKFSHVALGNN